MFHSFISNGNVARVPDYSPGARQLQSQLHPLPAIIAPTGAIYLLASAPAFVLWATQFLPT
jgi:hypothetical protein